jgi:tRNA G18 (ribose-2'-O)-methylase SpoU
MRIPIDDLEDRRLVPYRDLPRRNLIRQSGRFIAEGEKVVERLIESGLPVDSLLATAEVADRFEPLLPAETPIYVATPEFLAAAAGFNFHRGVLACGYRRPLDSLAELTAEQQGKAVQTWVVCPDVQDPTNLGAILRTCQGFGVDGVVLGKNCADPFSRRVLRVSMGGVFRLPIVESRDLTADLEFLKTELDCEVIATVLDDEADQLETCVRRPRLALLFGSEGHGLPAECIAASTRRVTLKMLRQADSFNVAAAAAMFLYHFCRAAKSP